MKKTLLGLAILAALAGSFGCQRVEPKAAAQIKTVAVCGTDTECEKGDALAKKTVYYCEAIKPDGTRCKRHVKEDGLLCWQHSAMVKAGKKVKTVK